VPCHSAGGGGGGAGGGAAGALAYFVPDTQHAWGTGLGTALFSRQRAFGPCTPGFTYVNAAHAGSFMHVDWHIAGSGAGRSKLR
jgi:hypothetical protein